MSDDRAKRLAQLQQAYESGILDEDTYRTAVNALGAQTQTTAEVIGSGAIAQGESATAVGERGVATQQAGVIITGDYNIVTLDEAFFRKVMGQPRPPEDLRQATRRYLQYLVDRYRYLEFKGMGVSDRVPLRLALQDLYVPLNARVELPHGDTWARDLLLAGRKMPEDEREHTGERLSEPMPLLDLLQQYSGLIILGDPGAGKTTFLKFLTLQLAMGSGAEPRLPVLVPLSAYANALAEDEVRLDDFIAGYFHDLGADLPLEAMLRQALGKGSAVVMLDGLDEVKEMGLRDTVVRRVVDFYTFHRPAGNKFLLTSRIIGYREVQPVAEGLTECTLVDFADEEIEDFCRRWTLAIEKAAREDTPVAAQEAAREQKEFLEAVRRNPGVRRLAANPLLLTILALMKRQGVTLPERRVELYQKYVETLLFTWNRARGLGRPPARDLDVVETVKVLAPLALWMHQVNPGVGLVKQNDLLRRLEVIYAERSEAHPERAARQFLSDVHDHAGLLLERGSGQYGFIHLTFEEYLAAVALAQQGQQSVEPVVSALAEHVGDPAWREVSLLTVGYLGIVQQHDQAASAVVEGLLSSVAGEPGEAQVLAGDAASDAWPGGVTAASKAQATATLLATLHDDQRVKASTRARAGDTLARLGDPRFRRDAWCLPDEPLLGFVEIPAGKFVMGDRNEKRALDLPAFYVARYPVTQAQFAAFVQAGGYKAESYWPEARTAGVWHDDGTVKGPYDDESRREPVDYGDLFSAANHPVVGVTWYEALAYCRWLTERLQGVSVIRQNQAVMLPSEVQWEKAARGPSTARLGSPKSDSDERTFPWGNEADPNRANYSDTGIGTTSAVGCFPNGASPYGVLDMSGNVWEWTRSIYKYYPYDSEDGREELGGTDARVLRGGAFGYFEVSVRCAYHFRDFPISRASNVGFRVVLSPL